ncbi:hypothetical protein HT105_24000, partial [Bacteroides fragilis]|nr:hypothetical protein [Bacteroides fragilis]
PKVAPKKPERSLGTIASASVSKLGFNDYDDYEASPKQRSLIGSAWK